MTSADLDDRCGLGFSSCLLDGRWVRSWLPASSGRNPVVEGELSGPICHEVQQNCGPSAVSGVRARVDKNLNYRRHAQ